MMNRFSTPGATTTAVERRQWPQLLLSVGFATALVVTLIVSTPWTSGATAVDTPTVDRPTIVVVHGAFASPSGWAAVVEGLEKDGYETRAVALDLDSLAGDVATVQATLVGIGGDKLLVGHSYGGIVISNAAVGRRDVLGLVYTAAYVPDTGDSIVSLGEGYAPPAFLAGGFPGHLIFDPFPNAIIDPVFFREDFVQDLNPKLAAAMAADQTPTNVALFTTSSGPGAWHDLPSWYAVSGQDRVIDPALQRWMAQRAGSAVVEFDDASHAGGFTHYAARFVKLVERAATATAA
jgi:pimeloyl-ACP methyl ester carboxylesterase